METIVTIALSVVGTLTMVGLFVIPVTNRFAIKRLTRENATHGDIDDSMSKIQRSEEHLHIRIDDLQKDVHTELERVVNHEIGMVKDEIRHFNDLNRELNGYVDSRFDKLESKIMEQINYLHDKVGTPTV